MADNVYYYDKKSPFNAHLLGEIQTDFDMSFTIDGTKDSAKIVIFSFIPNVIDPYTIIYHQNTQTWWCVSSDSVTRYANESGFYYVHTLQLLGAREIFNARDLVDDGFYQNRYTIDKFIKRLYSHANMEMPLGSINYNAGLDKDIVVNSIHTYENYTLLSALREFLDGYNCDFRVVLTTSGNPITTHLTTYNIVIIPKTGDISQDIIDNENDDVFNDVRENKHIDKNSFGTTVVSNAENVISSITKTYPTVGRVKLSADQYNIDSNTACLRLPSNVYKLNWLKLKFPAIITFEKENDNGWGGGTYYFDNDNSIAKFLSDVMSSISTNVPAALDSFNAQADSIVERLKLATTITFYDGNSIDPITGNIVQGVNVPYIPTIYKRSIWQGTQKVIITDETQAKCIPYPEQAITWKRGSNLITNFKFYNSDEGTAYKPKVNSFNDTDLQSGANEFFFRYPATGSYEFAICFRITSNDVGKLTIANSTFIANYVPMSDVKLKIDNQRESYDIDLYNQNGKLTDSVALSKKLNSYSKEISSDNITKYAQFYDFNSVPKAGRLVDINYELYVINSVSMRFSPNEQYSSLTSPYYIDCQFTLSKNVAVKSLLTNPNTNIRDYGIPQNFNVKRKQLYRDYIEFDYDIADDADIPYMDTYKNIDFGNYGIDSQSHVVLIRCQYDEQINGKNFYYYQLETTKYELDKMTIELLDFNDNNIIGYGAMNVYSAFQIDKIFSGLVSTINTPISYVDTKGEVYGINLRYCTNEQLTKAWNDYQNSTTFSGNTNYSLYNSSVFIPSDVYDNAYSDNDMEILENQYKKDAIEVPVFEYIFQVGDSENVLIGDSILQNKKVDESSYYLYGYYMSNANTLTMLNALQYAPTPTIVTSNVQINNAIEFAQSYGELVVKLYSFVQMIGGTTKIVGNATNVSSNKDYAIYRYKFTTTLGVTRLVSKELIMILKNVPNGAIQNNNEIQLFINCYNLK